MIDSRYAHFFDVDGTLLPAMATHLASDRQDLIRSFYDRLDGAMALVTGRPSSSLEETFTTSFPASIEHHSAWRRNGQEDFIALAPIVNTTAWATQAAADLKEKVPLFTNKKEILDKKPGVYLEAKTYSIAMVFSVMTPPAARMHIQTAADHILHAFGLEKTHRRINGADAVEIVPIGRGKVGAVEDFMKLPAFEGRIPVFWGDSSSDALAMKSCAECYAGWGIGVGDAIPKDTYIRTRLNTVDDVWVYLAEQIVA